MKRRKKQAWQSRKPRKASRVPHAVGNDGLPKKFHPEIQALIDAGILEISETSEETKQRIIDAMSKTNMLE